MHKNAVNGTEGENPEKRPPAKQVMKTSKRILRNRNHQIHSVSKTRQTGLSGIFPRKAVETGMHTCAASHAISRNNVNIDDQQKSANNVLNDDTTLVDTVTRTREPLPAVVRTPTPDLGLNQGEEASFALFFRKKSVTFTNPLVNQSIDPYNSENDTAAPETEPPRRSTRLREKQAVNRDSSISKKRNRNIRCTVRDNPDIDSSSRTDTPQQEYVTDRIVGHIFADDGQMHVQVR